MTSPQVITVTDAAAARLRVLLDRAGMRGVRVVVQSAGCDGFAALMDLAGGPAPGDVELAANGVAFWADVPSTLKLPGAVLDHVVTPHGSELVWTAPGCSGEG